jgi:hypothetical protein
VLNSFQFSQFRRLFGLAMLAAPLLTTSCNTLAVTDIYASLDQDGQRRRTEFRADAAAIFCIAEISSGRQDATIEILVRQGKGGGSVPEGTILARGEERSSGNQSQVPIAFLVPPTVGATAIAPGAGETTATVGNYVPGRYACEVYLEGGDGFVKGTNGQPDKLGKPDARVEYNVLGSARPTAQ